MRRLSGCKVNLLLNILGRREDGFHELESVMFPVPITEHLEIEAAPGAGIQLSCSHPELPVDAGNLVYRAASSFYERTGVPAGVRIHLEKRLPLAAGLGGGSANAAVTLAALNEIHGNPLTAVQLAQLGAGLGSDVPFFLQDGPALVSGRGEWVEPLAPLAGLRGMGMVLVHPGFGVSTPWAYQALSAFPEARNGRRGRAREWLSQLTGGDVEGACRALYNSLEAPVLAKYPLLQLFQEFFRAEGAWGALMSGSGSTTFALARDVGTAERMAARFQEKFGTGNWVAVTGL
ncbi:MAG: 4-(cytidine 5'-diphospho)-2-C-methyl-D-erythritol kinase [Verrucomicrobiales bacterium]|nr:4-(cytidine 5'-diphospho)-2-C-methyl-D-erythritol kinase [Verrucomicrobiales bacterium]